MVQVKMTKPSSVPRISIARLTLPHTTQPMDLVILYFKDQIFLTLTNDGKIGSLYHCRPISSIPPCSLDGTSSRFSSIVEQRMLGSCSPFHSILATEVSQCFYSFHSIPVVIGFTLPTGLTYEANKDNEDEMEKKKSWQRDWLHTVIQEVKRVIARERQ